MSSLRAKFTLLLAAVFVLLILYVVFTQRYLGLLTIPMSSNHLQDPPRTSVTDNPMKRWQHMMEVELNDTFLLVENLQTKQKNQSKIMDTILNDT